jgi:two-component system, LuxR family, response regulator DctR
VVDDDQSVRESIAYMLKVHDLDLILFEPPSALLDRVTPGDRGCLLLAVRMPEMNGLELFDALKEADISMPPNSGNISNMQSSRSAWTR